MQTNKDNLIVDLTFEFSLNIIEFTEELEQLRKFNMANQLFRSGISIGANVREAQNAEIKADFIHKIKVAAKEADETEYWLLLCEKAPSYPSAGNLLEKIKSINKILSKIISSSKKKPLNHQVINLAKKERD
jgi:four helix bundle protein